MRASPPLWIALVVMVTLSILWDCLIITGCVPPLGGNASILSNFHLMELVSGTRSVRFGYVAFCTLGEAGGKPTQICNTVNGLVNTSPQAIAAKLPNVNPQLFNIAFFMNRTVFPAIPAVSLVFLIIGSALLVVHWITRKGRNGQRKAQMIMIGTIACFGIALMMALVAAVSLTLTTAAIANMTALSNVGYVATRGETAFRLHWLAFATILVAMGLTGVILPAVGKGDGGGYDEYDEY